MVGEAIVAWRRCQGADRRIQPSATPSGWNSVAERVPGLKPRAGFLVPFRDGPTTLMEEKIGPRMVSFRDVPATPSER